MNDRGFAILAHRGLWGEHPQNSMGAVEAALEEGFGLELDVRPTRDGVLVLNHDPVLRMANGQQVAISDVAFQELQTHPLDDTDERVPRLADVLGLPRVLSTQVALHLKDFSRPETVELLAQSIPTRALETVFVFDISLTLCRRLKESVPGLKVGVSVGDKKYHQYFYDLEELEDTPVDIVWADEYRNLYTQEFISAAREIGKTVYAVSPDIASEVGHPLARAGYEETWQRLYSWGVEGICTDKPHELRSMLEAVCR